MGLTYFENISFTICGIIFLLVVLLIAYSKRQTAKISYRFIVIFAVTLIMLVLELFCPYAIMIKDSNKILSTIIIRLYFLAMYVFTLQLFLVASKVCSKNNKEFNGKKLIRYEVYVLGYTAVLILSLALGVDYIIVEGQPYVLRGLVFVLHNVITAITCAIELIMLIRANKPVTRLAAKIFATGLVLYILVLVFESVFNYYATTSGVLYAMLMLITYCTIESQDFTKNIEIENEIKNLETSNKNKNEALNKLYYQARTEVSLILDYGNLIEEEGVCSEEQTQNMYDIVSDSASNLDNLLNSVKESD